MILPETNLTNTLLIYGIRDPKDTQGKYRYVGKTKNLRDRATAHLRDSRNIRHRHVCNWINSLNGEVVFDILEICTTREEVSSSEVRWIQYLKDAGHDLTNHTLGGEGAFGRVVSEATKNKISKSVRETLAKRVWTDEERKAASEKQNGRKMSDDARTKLSKSMSGKSIPQATRDKISKSLTGRRNPHVGKGNHTRYHTNRGIVSDRCEHCLVI